MPRTRTDVATTRVLGVVYTGLTRSFFVSLRYLTAGLATIVLSTYPVMAVILAAAFLDETITADKVGTLGLVLAMGAAASYAGSTTASRTLVASLPPRGLMLWVLLGTTLSVAAYGLVTGGIGRPSGADEWAVVVGRTLVGTVVPLVLFYEGVARLEASRVGIVSSVEPVVTVSLGAVLLGEGVTPAVVAGGLLVLGGVRLVQRRVEAAVDLPRA